MQHLIKMLFKYIIDWFKVWSLYNFMTDGYYRNGINDDDENKSAKWKLMRKIFGFVSLLFFIIVGIVFGVRFCSITPPKEATAIIGESQDGYTRLYSYSKKIIDPNDNSKKLTETVILDDTNTVTDASQNSEFYKKFTALALDYNNITKNFQFTFRYNDAQFTQLSSIYGDGNFSFSINGNSEYISENFHKLRNGFIRISFNDIDLTANSELILSIFYNDNKIGEIKLWQKIISE